MVYHLNQLLNKTKDHVSEHRSRGSTSNEVVLDYINDSVGYICAEILVLRKDFFSAYQDITLDGSREYDLSLGIERVFAVEDITDSSNPADTEPMRFDERFQQVSSICGSIRYYLRNRKIGFPGKPNGRTVRVWYPKLPTRLWKGTCSAVSGTSITMSTPSLGTWVPEDDWLNGMFLVSTDGQYRQIVDSVGSTKVLTLNSAFSSNPTVGSTELSLAVPFATQHQDLIHMRGGIFWRMDLDLPIGDQEALYEKKATLFRGVLSKEQTHRPAHVVKTRRRAWI